MVSHVSLLFYDFLLSNLTCTYLRSFYRCVPLLDIENILLLSLWFSRLTIPRFGFNIFFHFNFEHEQLSCPIMYISLTPTHSLHSSFTSPFSVSSSACPPFPRHHPSCRRAEDQLLRSWRHTPRPRPLVWPWQRTEHCARITDICTFYE